MTWSDWANSEYNTIGVFTGTYVYLADQSMISTGITLAKPNDVIQEGKVYVRF